MARDVSSTVDRRARLLDEVRKALEELRAEGPAPCCHKGRAGCLRHERVRQGEVGL